MSVQTTIEITRSEAERKWVEKRLETLRSSFATAAKGMTDTQLEDEVEEQFYNYQIVDEE